MTQQTSSFYNSAESTRSPARLRGVLTRLPAEIRPIVGTLYYRQFERSRLLIADLVKYVLHELQAPLAPELGPAMTEERAREIFTTLDALLTAYAFYQHLGEPSAQLVLAAREMSFSQAHLSELDAAAAQVWHAPAVQQSLDAYLDADRADRLTCFYCNRRIDIGGPDASTELGILWSCRADWEAFGNPDQFI